MKTKTPKYRIELSCIDFNLQRKIWASFAYSVKDSGAPNEANAKKYRDGMNDSILRGANTHLINVQSLYSNVRIINQFTGEQVCAYTAPMFEVI